MSFQVAFKNRVGEWVLHTLVIAICVLYRVGIEPCDEGCGISGNEFRRKVRMMEMLPLVVV